MITVIVIVWVWTPVLKDDVFVSIRDQLLMSNPLGRKINNFYYQYTLFPAETFKSLDQKLLKSCHLSIGDENVSRQVKKGTSCRGIICRCQTDKGWT